MLSLLSTQTNRVSYTYKDCLPYPTVGPCIGSICRSQSVLDSFKVLTFVSLTLYTDLNNFTEQIFPV